ncbi:Sgn1p Ecym_4483 [Eremothecium cymbalariae DBVPG|uniref:RRM domain-containing protein n=1 Tax=Eremothecium cymbalariae (strain CBS 270.75 / DBVPG 7215 / KCTC 17166 / NRRL Y-17582) TaxID=931890 RepID=G8JU20_ERECY|nr:hypothetical protein Ecym_4483 [Eremothecium cymbalariae DBVPG\
MTESAIALPLEHTATKAVTETVKNLQLDGETSNMHELKDQDELLETTEDGKELYDNTFEGQKELFLQLGKDEKHAKQVELDTRSIFVSSITPETTAETLETHFKDVGMINRITILHNKRTGEPKGYAYIEFEMVESVAKALELNGSEFNNKIITVAKKRTNLPGFGKPFAYHHNQHIQNTDGSNSFHKQHNRSHLQHSHQQQQQQLQQHHQQQQQQQHQQRQQYFYGNQWQNGFIHPHWNFAAYNAYTPYKAANYYPAYRYHQQPQHSQNISQNNRPQQRTSNGAFRNVYRGTYNNAKRGAYNGSRKSRNNNIANNSIGSVQDENDEHGSHKHDLPVSSPYKPVAQSSETGTQEA